MFEQDVAGEYQPLCWPRPERQLNPHSTGLIKALRANKNDESVVIQRALDETRKEIKSKDAEVKAAAVLKLVYVRHQVELWPERELMRFPFRSLRCSATPSRLLRLPLSSV
jgi:hypothetical protein